MNPATKFILDFIHTVDLEPLLDDVRKGLRGLKGTKPSGWNDWIFLDKQDK